MVFVLKQVVAGAAGQTKFHDFLWATAPRAQMTRLSGMHGMHGCSDVAWDCGGGEAKTIFFANVHMRDHSHTMSRASSKSFHECTSDIACSDLSEQERKRVSEGVA